MRLSTYQSHERRLIDAEVAQGAEVLERAATAIREAYAETDTDFATALEQGEIPVVDISVSFDGTWMKRGFSSLHGIGAVIDLLTGLVVDYQVMSKYCHACKLAEQKYGGEELAKWKAEHQSDWCINHLGPSKSVEQEAAKMIWGQSLQKHKFRYVEMLSDGDSATLKAVTNADPYSGKTVEKLYCLNNAHKRMGSALRQLAKTERLGGGGVGRLTEKKCELLQNYYRGAVLGNNKSVEEMRSAIWATFFHSISTDEENFHHRCPSGKDSWCFYNVALANDETPPSHKSHPSSTFLKQEVAEKVVQVYRRMTLTAESLLSRLLHGGTQNQNECFNAQIWMRCPKTTFVGRRKLEGSVARTVGIFNEGATDLARIMDKLWVDLSTMTLENLADLDAKRMAQADEAAKVQMKGRRKQHVSERRQEQREQERREGPSYGNVSQD